MLETVSSSREEAQLLRAALSDFSRDGARADYAKWLRDLGDRDRASTVIATIDAYHDHTRIDSSRLAGDAGWKVMMAIPLLAEFNERVWSAPDPDFKALKGAIFSRIRPALSLSYIPAIREPELAASSLWGLPDIPDDQDWPTVAEVSDWFGCRSDLPQDYPCAFNGQIAFDDISESVLGQDLPQGTGFQFFSITEVMELGITETLLRPWDRTKKITRRQPPPQLVEDTLGDSVNSPSRPHAIHFREVISIPDATDGPFTQIIPDCQWSERYSEDYRALLNACGKNTLGLGGYLRGTSGGDPSPDVESLRFATLRTAPDCGVAHFAISADNMRAGDVTQAEYVWNDWDS